MAPFAYPHKVEEGVEEVLEVQNTAHYYPNIANLQPISFFESINSVLHVTKSTDANFNGSQTGSSGGALTTPPGQGEFEEETDVAVLLALFVPLAATVTAIFIIALFVRRMRRSESAHEIHHRSLSMKNEFQMTPIKKNSAQSTVSVMSTTSSLSSSNTSQQSTDIRSSTPTSQTTQSAKDSSSNNGSVNAIPQKNNGISKSQNLNGSTSSLGGSLYRNSSYFRIAPHYQLQYQSSLPVTGVSTSPNGPTPPWQIAPESGFFYTRSHYGLNKLHQQLYQQASLQAFSSIQSLNGLPISRQYSDPQTYCSHSDPEMETSSSSDEGNNSNTKKSSNKKLKRVLSAINFPRKIRQYQADRKRFNIYTIPVETREQLKHIYVY